MITPYPGCSVQAAGHRQHEEAAGKRDAVGYLQIPEFTVKAETPRAGGVPVAAEANKTWACPWALARQALWC